MKKLCFYSELCYLLGLIALAVGAVFMVHANFGVSVVVAPAYLIYLKLSQTWHFITFGLAEYLVQGILLLILILLVRRFHWSYLFSFVTTLLYGRALDLFMWLFRNLALPSIPVRMLFYLLGLFICAVGVALILRTYLSPEVYELFLKELTGKFHWPFHRVKTIYDCLSCTVSIVLSFSFFGLFVFQGIHVGTVIAALVNGFLISKIGKYMDRHVSFVPRFPSIKSYFSPPPFPENDPNA